MAILINGVDVREYIGEFYDIDDNRTGVAEFGTKIKGLSIELDNGTKKVVTGELYDAFEGKLKHNGALVRVAPRGTRPMNIFQKDGGTNYYIINNDGTLYYNTANSIDGATKVVTSTEKNKHVVFNLATWGAGGKGGAGAYWFLKGDWGGVGGSGGSKQFLKISLPNNSYMRFSGKPDGSTDGRVTSGDTSYGYHAYGINLIGQGVTGFNGSDPIFSEVIFSYSGGGYSGCNCNTYAATDELNSSAVGTGMFTTSPSGADYGLWLSAYQLKYKQGAQKVWNGNSGNSCVFSNTSGSVSYVSKDGNPENETGDLALTGSGGSAPGSNRAYGSGGGGSYGSGGTGSRNDVWGGAGSQGGGGGGGGTRANGTTGGNGGGEGFIIFY